MLNKKLIKVNIVYKGFSRKIIKNIFIDYCMQNILEVVLSDKNFVFFGNLFKDKLIEIDITITNNKYISNINNRWMFKNKPTDVLSFPLTDFQSNQLNESNKIFLGDILISYEYLISYCNFHKIKQADHFLRLLSHGFLHLLGFDHKNEIEARKMINLENIILYPLIKGSGLTTNFFNNK